MTHFILWRLIGGKRYMTNDPFTNEELDKLYNLVQDEYDEVMCGDWEAVKTDIADLHVLMSKLIYAQQKLNNS